MNEAIFKAKAQDVLLRDGKKYTLMPLTINQVIDVWPLIAELDKLNDDPRALNEDTFGKMRKLVSELLKASGYDGITEKKVGDLVDLADIRQIIAIVIGQNPDLAQNLKK